jgi:hypothetical protein
MVAAPQPIELLHSDQIEFSDPEYPILFLCNADDVVAADKIFGEDDFVVTAAANPIVTDWRPLRGRSVFVWAEAGESAQAAYIANNAAKAGAAQISTVDARGHKIVAAQSAPSLICAIS